MDNHVIGVIGLGYIGQPTVAALANVGYRVVGMDVDRDKVAQLSAGAPTLYEPGLAETLLRVRPLLRFTTSYQELMAECDAVFVTVGTPLDDLGQPSMAALDTVVANLGKHLRSGHVVILRSTVVPGTTEKVARALESASGLKCGKDFYVSFCPERTIEGLALHELYHLPKIIGGTNPESTERTVQILRRMGSKVIAVSSSTVAELCKLADNMYRALNVAFANEFGNICEAARIDAYEVVDAVNSAYHRTSIFRPALGAGGPCLSKDPQILHHFAQSRSIGTPIIEASVKGNIAATARVASAVEQFVVENGLQRPKIAALGLAFKGVPETDDARGAPAETICRRLLAHGSNPEIRVFDPIIRDFLGLSTHESLEDCIGGANVVLFLTDHPTLKNIALDRVLSRTARPLLIVDAWHNVARNPLDKLPDGTRLVRIGDGR